MGRAVPNSQGHPGTRRAAAAGRPGQDPLPSCPGSPHLPGDRRWQGLAAIWGSPGMGFGGRGGPCIAVFIGLGAGDAQTPLHVGGGAVAAEGGPGDDAVPSRAIPSCLQVLRCPAPSSRPGPQRIPGISALASRLSRPRSAHECPFPPAGSGRELSRSPCSSRAVAIVTLLPVPESPGRYPSPSAGAAWYPPPFPSPKPHPSSQPPSLLLWGDPRPCSGWQLEHLSPMVCRARDGGGVQRPIAGSGRGANPSPGVQWGGGSATESGGAAPGAGGLPRGWHRGWAGSLLSPVGWRRNGKDRGGELLWCQGFKRASKGPKEKLLGKQMTRMWKGESQGGGCGGEDIFVLKTSVRGCVTLVL